MAKDPSTGDLVSDWPDGWETELPAAWTEPPTEAQLNRLSQLNEQLNMPPDYYAPIGRMLRTSIGVRRAIALFEKYGTPK